MSVQPLDESDVRALADALSDDELIQLIEQIKPYNLYGWIARVTPKHAPLVDGVPRVPPHLSPLIDALQRVAKAINGDGPPVRLLVSMPPRHAKTETVMHGLAWLIERFPDKLNAYVTYNTTKAKPKSRKIRRLALSAGVALDDMANAVGEWRTKAGGGLLSTGIGGALTGYGVDGCLVVDDPFKGRKEAESELMRENVWEWFNDVAFTRLMPGASCVVVATRWHHDDLIGRLAAMGTPDDPTPWEVINVPAIRDREDIFDAMPSDGDGQEEHALWPEQWPLETMRSIRKQVGPYTWASLYQGQPVPKGGVVFGNPGRYETIDLHGMRLVIGVDPAGSSNTKADHTAAVVLAVKGTGETQVAYVMEVLRFQKDTTDDAQLKEAATKLYQLQARWGHRGLVIEKTRDGVAIARAMRSIAPALKIIEQPPFGDKLARSQPVAAAWNDNRVLVPLNAPWAGDFLSELGKFTGVHDRHDDQVDALAHAWNAATSTAPVRPPRVVGASRWGDQSRERGWG